MSLNRPASLPTSDVIDCSAMRATEDNLPLITMSCTGLTISTIGSPRRRQGQAPARVQAFPERKRSITRVQVQVAVLLLALTLILGGMALFSGAISA